MKITVRQKYDDHQQTFVRTYVTYRSGHDDSACTATIMEVIPTVTEHKS